MFGAVAAVVGAFVPVLAPSKLASTFVNCVGLVVPVLSAAGVGFTKAVFNGVAAGSIGSITLLSASTNLPSALVPTAGFPASLIG